MAKSYRPSRSKEDPATRLASAQLCFGRFCLDMNYGVLRSGDKTLPIRPKTLALLTLFVTNPGRVLTHDAIVEAIWPDIVVTDVSIAQCVRDSAPRAQGGRACGQSRPCRVVAMSSPLRRFHGPLNQGSSNWSWCRIGGTPPCRRNQRFSELSRLLGHQGFQLSEYAAGARGLRASHP